MAKENAVGTSGGQARTPLHLVLEDGSVFSGYSFGAEIESVGEVVFNTGMVGYPESFTDPSYRGQILVLTYPLIGNYGVPADFENELASGYESSRIHLAGLVVSDYSEFHSHWTAQRGLSDLLREQGIPAISGVDTRALTRHLRERGTMAGRIVSGAKPPPGAALPPLPLRRLVAEVSVREVRSYGAGKKRVALVDCGCKNSIVRSLVSRNVSVVRIAWDFDVTTLDVHGVLYSNGPGDPTDCAATIARTDPAIRPIAPPRSKTPGARWPQVFHASASASAHRSWRSRQAGRLTSSNSGTADRTSRARSQARCAATSLLRTTAMRSTQSRYLPDGQSGL